jgi:hypothetical protein
MGAVLLGLDNLRLDKSVDCGIIEKLDSENRVEFRTNSTRFFSVAAQFSGSFSQIKTPIIYTFWRN